MGRARLPKQRPLEIFLSHSSRDGQFATELAGVLRRHGLRVWYSRTDIRGSQEWQDEIGVALARCTWFAVILSPASIAQSIWVKRELSYALNEPRYQDRIVPVLYRPCDPKKLSWTLPTIQYVDFTGDRANGYHELLRIWGIGYAE